MWFLQVNTPVWIDRLIVYVSAVTCFTLYAGLGKKMRISLFKSTLPKMFFVFICCANITNTKLYGQRFTTTQTKQGVEILEQGRKVLFYQEQPKSLDGKYERAGYVHPLYSLNEKVLTEDLPVDHPYHRGIFWAWHQIILKDKMIANGWVCENISWQPVKLKIAKNEEFVMLQSEMLWKAVLQPDKSTPIIKENTRITVHRSTGQYRAIDFDIRLYALVDSLKIGGSDDIKGYGGFCTRLKLPADISFVSNNSVITPIETAVTAGSWMDIRGSFDKDEPSKTGVAVFSNPSNPGPGNQWILRKEGSMQNIPYPGRAPVALTKNGWRLQYRIIIHNDNMSNEALEKLYQDYIHKL